jgi:hypothetical protein
MKKLTLRGSLLSLAIGGVMGGVFALTGCANQNATPPLYQWTGYQPEVYAYFKNVKSPQEQIDGMEKALQEIAAKGNHPPPGFYAHLGMLYASVGDGDKAMKDFAAEKAAFPESSAFMDFLAKDK